VVWGQTQILTFKDKKKDYLVFEESKPMNMGANNGNISE
jgi:hypothetical protein